MQVSIVIATHGDPAWQELAYSRAYPSTIGQGALEVVVAHEDTESLAYVRNVAAQAATGDWLCFLDADDELAPGYLGQMHRALARGRAHRRASDELPLLAPAVQYVHAGVDAGPALIPSKGRWPDLNECVIGTLVHRPLFLDLGGFRDLPSLEDYDLWLRCSIAGARIVHVPAAVYRAHVTPGSRNSDQSVYQQLRVEHAQAWS